LYLADGGFYLLTSSLAAFTRRSGIISNRAKCENKESGRADADACED